MGLSSAESMLVIRWTEEQGQLVCHRTSIAPSCDWGEIDALCARLSAILDCHDRDRFAHLLRYGG